LKAVLCTAFGDLSALSYEEVDPPPVGPDDVLIDVRAAGVNFPDLLLVQGKYQTRPLLPFSPGFEVAGRVAEVGPAVTSMQPGDRVLATLEYGGYAELAVAAEERVLRLPDPVDYQRAAGFPIVYGTAYHALVDRAALQPAETLVVTGAAGGVGLAAVQVGKALGARVIGAVGSDEKGELVQEQGADEVVNYSTEDLRPRVKELTDGRGADVVFDPVGGDVFDQLVRTTAWGGRMLVIGFTSGRIPEVPTNLVLLRGFSVVGVYWGSFSEHDPEASRANFDRLLGMLASENLRPYVSATYPLERAAEALAAVAARRTMGKVVLEVDHDA
jgi:NADPH2:quinone reductase